MKKKNKGFTLVELIVVLVILAILAAILVPALLGYIDKAKSKQLVLNARSCMVAAQAEMSELYALGKTDIDGYKAGGSGSRYVDISGTSVAEAIMNTADVPDCTYLVIGFNAEMNVNEHAGYTVSFVYYSEDDKSVYFDGKSWQEGSWPDIASSKYLYYVRLPE
jgi:prepilin-type N-terminal cleavage/methylation domain-containing protein